MVGGIWKGLLMICYICPNINSLRYYGLIKICLIMSYADQMCIKVVHVATIVPATVAFPGVGVTVEAPMQKVEGLVGKHDLAMVTLVLEPWRL